MAESDTRDGLVIISLYHLNDLLCLLKSFVSIPTKMYNKPTSLDIFTGFLKVFK